MGNDEGGTRDPERAWSFELWHLLRPFYALPPVGYTPSILPELGAIMRCPACNAETVAEAVYCHRCGQRLATTATGFAIDRPPEDEPAPAASITNATGELRTPNVSGPKTEPERELWRGGYSSKAMAGGWAISGTISLLAAIAGVWIRPRGYWWLAVLAAMLLPWLYHFIVLCYRWMGVRYLLTTQRFTCESGVLRRVTDRIEVLDMDDITFEQHLLERLTGVGTIHILSHDRSNPDLSLRGIENVKQVANLLDDARLAERRRRGLHIEQI
ncbi:MAG: PH domain-containing protein [Planctomycetaceae bacterium]|nr:PH domain-containing protein [Planctomycetaceae bacterium]